MSDKGTTSAAVDKWNKYHEGKEPPPWESGYPSAHLKTYLESFDGAHDRAIEVGCGSGVSTCYMASLFDSVVGIDVSHAAINRAKEQSARLPALASKPLFLCEEIFELSKMDKETLVKLGLKPNSFSFAFDCQCFHVFDQDQRIEYGKALRRFLREGATLLLLCGNAGEEQSSTGPSMLTYSEVASPFAAAGFSVVTIEETRFDPTPKYKPKPPLAWKCVFKAD